MSKETGLALNMEGALNNVTAKIKEMQENRGLVLPKTYCADNAVKLAWLQLAEVKDKGGKPALEVCTKTSIIEAFTKMVTLGLNPAKSQCYPIVRGTQLCMDISYFGKQVAVKRLEGISDITSAVIYEGDNFEYKIDPSTGKMKIINHEQKLENIDPNKVRAAYCYIIKENGENYLEVMTKAQIKAAWEMGQMKGNSSAHKGFPDEMARKSVISRACKRFLNSSDDTDLIAEAINENDRILYSEEDIIEETNAEVKEEIKENANKEVIDIPVEEVKEASKEEVKGKTKIPEMGF